MKVLGDEHAVVCHGPLQAAKDLLECLVHSGDAEGILPRHAKAAEAAGTCTRALDAPARTQKPIDDWQSMYCQ